MDREQRKAFNRHCRRIEKAALSCLAPPPKHDVVGIRQRKVDKKMEAVTDRLCEFLRDIANVDPTLCRDLQTAVFPTIDEWARSLEQDVHYPGDLRSKPRT